MAKQILYLSYIKFDGSDILELTGVCSCIQQSLLLNRDLHYEEVENRDANIEIYTTPLNTSPNLDEIVFSTNNEDDLAKFLK